MYCVRESKYFGLSERPRHLFRSRAAARCVLDCGGISESRKSEKADLSKIKELLLPHSELAIIH